MPSSVMTGSAACRFSSSSLTRAWSTGPATANDGCWLSSEPRAPMVIQRECVDLQAMAPHHLFANETRRGPKRKSSPRSSRPESQTEVRHHPRTARINSEVRGVGRRYGRWGERCAKHSPIGRERCRLLNVANTGASAEAERLKALKASCLMQASASAASLWGPLLVHLLREYLRNETGSAGTAHRQASPHS